MDSLPGGSRKCLFFTGTLPGSTGDAMRAIASWSGYIVNCFKAWISKWIPQKMDYYAWELQRRGALHFHYCVYVADDAIRQKLKIRMKSEWIRILKSVSAKSGIDLFERADGKGSWACIPEKVQAYAQECRKSVAAYLSKYLSKRRTKDSGPYCPSRWWGVSRPLRALLKSLSIEEIFYSLHRRDAESKFEDICRAIESGCPKSYGYSCKGFSRVVAGYGEIWTMEDIRKLVPRKYQLKSSTSSHLLAAISQELRSAARFTRALSTRSHGGSFASVQHMESALRDFPRISASEALDLAERLRSRLYFAFRGDSMEKFRELHLRKMTKGWILMSKVWRRAGCRDLTVEELFSDLPEEWLDAALKYWSDDRTGTSPNFADHS